ncbi:hypothetical protein MNB_SUP05-SYMBIONT-4-576 [hydrothermal vent metagenome]|uniref:Uncharacterized protein n=1 Tax=hydrothermal vent metagenome TaxID=652676 RepID=A0A1W1DVA0_9ZZZZ
MTRPSRTTLWQLENKGKFPYWDSLGKNNIDWKFSEIKE